MKFLTRWYERRLEKVYQRSLDEAEEIIQTSALLEAEEEARQAAEKVRQDAMKVYDQCMNGLAHDRAPLTAERRAQLASISADNYLLRHGQRLQTSEVRAIFFEVFQQNS